MPTRDSCGFHHTRFAGRGGVEFSRAPASGHALARNRRRGGRCPARKEQPEQPLRAVGRDPNRRGAVH